MPLSPSATEFVEKFLTDIEPLKDAYQNESFSYFAIKNGLGFELVKGTLYLNVMPPTVPLGAYQSENVKCGHFKLSDVNLGWREYLERIITGTIPIPGGTLSFPDNGNSMGYGAQYHPFSSFGLPARRVPLLMIFGGSNRDILAAQRQQLDWEVRGNPIPYDGLDELLHEYQPGVLQEINRIDIAGLEIGAIDGSSRVTGETAQVIVKAASRARPKDVDIGLRILDKGKVVQRISVNGEKFTWRQNGDDLATGTFQLRVPKAAVVQGLVRYKDIAQHHYYFGDPNSFQNPRRAAYEAFDPGFKLLEAIMAKTTEPQPEASNFEAVVGWVFWMLGFAPAQLSSSPRMRDQRPDLLLGTPGGNIVVMECTTGLLKEDSKLAKLHDRTERVRSNLTASAASHVRILPVIVTSKSTTSIKPDVEQAEKLGIYVVPREGLERLIVQTLIIQDAEKQFADAEKVVRENLARHELTSSHNTWETDQ